MKHHSADCANVPPVRQSLRPDRYPEQPPRLPFYETDQHRPLQCPSRLRLPPLFYPSSSYKIFKIRFNDRFLSFMAKTDPGSPVRSEEHTSELQSLIRISYAVSCFKNKK